MKFLLYSTQTRLANRISQRYFNSVFHVHCCETFSPANNPRSSNPASLYQDFRRIVEDDDRGDPKMADIKRKLKEVALTKFAAGELTSTEYDSLTWEVNRAETRDFIPMLYLIVRSELKKKQLAPVPINARANPNSEEFIIASLKESQFEVIAASLTLSGGF
jgi:hypothetical protein